MEKQDESGSGTTHGSTLLMANGFELLSHMLRPLGVLLFVPGLAPPPGVVTTAHIDVAKSWDDAIECLLWSSENGATVAEMRAYRRMQHGQDVTIDE